MRLDRALVYAAAMMCLGSAPASAAPTAEVDVRGFGLLGNREMERSLSLLLDDGTRPALVDAGFIEDAALVLNSELVERGYHQAAVRVRWETPDGARGEALLDGRLTEPLPRPLLARRVWLRAEPGVRAVVADVEFKGLTEMGEDEAARFFRPDSGLYTTAAARSWSEDKMRRAAESMREELRARGLAEADVSVVASFPEAGGGEVNLVVTVTEGPRWRVVGWRAEVTGGGASLGGVPDYLPGSAWTRALAMDLAQATRAAYHRAGYAEARVRWRAEPAESPDAKGERPVTAVAEVDPGAAWTIGEVRFSGAVKTRVSTLETRARGLVHGAPYDPAEIDATRLRLARLGVFRTVEANGSDADGGEWRRTAPMPMAARAGRARWFSSWPRRRGGPRPG
ncbi:MAG: hypothetical protein MUE42_06650 [Opitutaceae bacterium]|nr:hypothetical protein [Opitutaceae bacterium]